MFNFQGSELIIILLLALVVLGPEKLPEAMRKFGEFYGELKKMSSSFQKEFQAVVDEPMRELRETANTIRDSADFTKFRSGEREEKPKSADMLAAPDPNVTPTDEVPFAAENTDEAAGDDHPVSAPSAPFSASQSFSAAPRKIEVEESSLPPQVAVDDEFGLREARPAEGDQQP